MQGKQGGDGGKGSNPGQIGVGGGEPPGGDERLRVRADVARQRAWSARETGMESREAALTTRELSLSEREELARLRDEALSARERAREAAAARERLIAQMREANEKLVLATLRADALADEAEAARRRIAQSEERFRSLVTTSAAVVFQAGADGHIRVDAESFESFTGLSVRDAGDGWLEAVYPADRAPLRVAWRHARAAGKEYTHQHRLLRRDGSWAWVVSRAVPIPGGGQPLREWIGTITDVTDRVRVEQAREQFIGILGHDLRNPLGAISMGVQSLKRDDLSPAEAAAIAARVDRSVFRMAAMIRDLLDFARGRLGDGIPLKRGRCDLGALCEETVGEMRQAWPRRTISCELVGDLAGDWDADRLAQVLSNLVGNAIEHGSDPIAVSARGDGDEVVLSVHNHGAPIPPESLATLFEPFRSGTSHGIGLGLYIASEIMRAHGGTIAVTSTAAEGTTFTMRWPRSDQ